MIVLRKMPAIDAAAGAVPAFWSVALAASNSIRAEGACLRLGEFAFPRNALMQFVGALDPIFVLAIAWKVLDHLIDATWHKPTDCRVEGYKLSDLEFVRAHMRVAQLSLSLSSSILAGYRDEYPGTPSVL
jgi:hypothetical protein